MFRLSGRQPRLFSQRDFTGGLAFPGQTDAEAEQFEYLELGRDGYHISLLGSVKHNSAAINANQIVGIGRANFSASGLVGDVILVAKKGVDWFRASANSAAPVAYTALTSPQDPLADVVRFEQANQLSGSTNTAYVLFTNVNFTAIVQWDGNNANLPANIAGSPANCTLIRQGGARTFASGQAANPFTIYFSDANNPLSWPSNNFFNVPSSRGIVTGIERLSSGQMLIFTERSILSLLGDVPLDFSLTMIQEGIGCDQPRTISTLGNTIVFAFQGDLYAYTGGISALTERLRGVTLLLPTNGVASNGFCALTPNFLFYRPSENTSTASPPVSTTDQNTILHVFDRQRTGWWGVWKYATATGLGTSQPPQPVIYNLDNRLLLGGGDGTVYQQTYRVVDTNNVLGTFETPTFTQDATTQNITATYRSRLINLEDWGLQKTHGKIQIDGTCASGTGAITVRIIKADGTATTASSSNLTFPTEVSSLGTTNTRFKAIQVQISGVDLQLFSYAIHWMPLALVSIQGNY